MARRRLKMDRKNVMRRKRYKKKGTVVKKKGRKRRRGGGFFGDVWGAVNRASDTLVDATPGIVGALTGMPF